MLIFSVFSDDLVQLCVDYLKEYPVLVGGCVSMPILLCLAFFFLMRSEEQKPRKSKKKKNKEENGVDRRSTRVCRPTDRFQSNDYRK